MKEIGLHSNNGSVGIIITVDQNQYILQRRDSKSYIFFPGLLGLFGGAVDPAETDYQAAARELHEELFLNVKTPRLKKIASQKFSCDFFQNGKTRCRSFFHLDITVSEKRKMCLGEGAGIEYYGLNELPSSDDIVPTDFLTLRLFLMKSQQKRFEPATW